MNFRQSVEQHELALITQLLVENKGLINRSALKSGMPKKTLIRKIRKYGINTSSFKDPVSKSETSTPVVTKLSQLIKDGKAIILARGHSNNRFHRDYKTGTASYVCKSCGSDFAVSLYKPEGCEGTVLSNSCVLK